MRRTAKTRFAQLSLGLILASLLAASWGGPAVGTEAASPEAESAELPATFPVRVDLVMGAEEAAALLDQHTSAALRSGEPQEDVVIGVLPSTNVPEADVMSRGGAAAAALDDELNAAQAAQIPVPPAAPPCPDDDPLGGGGVYLLCEGSEPVVVFRGRPIDASLPVADRVAQALRKLAQAPAAPEQESRLWSPLADMKAPVIDIEFGDGTLIVNFSSEVATLPASSGLDAAQSR